MSEVVRLIERAPGFSPDDPADLFLWASEWLEGLKSGDYGAIRLATISQSLGAMDGARLIGLLHMAAHRKADGAANIEDLR